MEAWGQERGLKNGAGSRVRSMWGKLERRSKRFRVNRTRLPSRRLCDAEDARRNERLQGWDDLDHQDLRWPQLTAADGGHATSAGMLVPGLAGELMPTLQHPAAVADCPLAQTCLKFARSFTWNIPISDFVSNSKIIIIIKTLDGPGESFQGLRLGLRLASVAPGSSSVQTLSVVSQGPEEKAGSGGRLPVVEGSLFQNISATVRSFGQEKPWSALLLLGSVLPPRVPANIASGPQASCPPSSFLPHNEAPCGPQAPARPMPQVPSSHLPRHLLLLLFIQLCPQQDAAASLPDNCQPEVWTPSPWWLPLFH